MSAENKYQYIDLEYINDMGDGDTEFLIKIIGVYLNAIPADLERLQEAMSAKNGEEILFYAHKLKGSFNFIGSTQLTESFDTIEAYSVTPSTMTHIPPIIDKILDQSAHITVELNDFLALLKAGKA